MSLTFRPAFHEVPDPRSTYRQLCAEHAIPLQSQDWWLDSLCGTDGWEVSVAFDAKGRPVGALPYFPEKRYGLRLLRQPALSTYTNLWLAYPDSDRPYREYGFEKQVIGELLQQLPAHAWFDLRFHPDLTNWLPFYWQGFHQTTRYTYVLEELSDLAAVHRGLSSQARNHLRQARQDLTIEVRDDLPAFLGVVEKTFSRQKMPLPFQPALLERLDAALQQRRQRKIFFALDASGRIHAAAYVVWDDRRAHYLLSGSDPVLRSSGAVYFLIWEVIKDCAKHVPLFDFEGSMLPQIEPVFRSFGGRLQPYFRIWRAGNRILEMLWRWKGRV